MKLNQIAQKMIQFARQHPYHNGANTRDYSHTLTRHLALCYIIVDGQITLALSRQNVWPSQQEEAICKAAFSVPGYAYRKQNQKGIYFHITYTWPDGPARPLVTLRFEASSAPAALPAGAWHKDGDFIIVNIESREMLHWFTLANLATKEAGPQAEPEQATMFDTSKNYYEHEV